MAALRHGPAPARARSDQARAPLASKGAPPSCDPAPLVARWPGGRVARWQRWVSTGSRSPAPARAPGKARRLGKARAGPARALSDQARRVPLASKGAGPPTEPLLAVRPGAAGGARWQRWVLAADPRRRRGPLDRRGGPAAREGTGRPGKGPFGPSSSSPCKQRSPEEWEGLRTGWAEHPPRSSWIRN